MKTDRLSSPQYQTHTWTGHAMVRGYCGLVTRPQVKLRNIKYGPSSFCDGRCLGEVVKGYQEIMWRLGRRGAGDCDDVRRWSSHSSPDWLWSPQHTSHCTLTALTLQLTVCWVLSVEMFTLVWILSSPVSQSVLAALAACERPARLPASRLCYLLVDRQVGTQLGPDQGPEQEFHQNAKLNISGNACLAWQLPQHLLSGANKHFIPGRNNLRGRSLFNVKCSCPN